MDPDVGIRGVGKHPLDLVAERFGADGRERARKARAGASGESKVGGVLVTELFQLVVGFFISAEHHDLSEVVVSIAGAARARRNQDVEAEQIRCRHI